MNLEESSHSCFGVIELALRGVVYLDRVLTSFDVENLRT